MNPILIHEVGPRDGLQAEAAVVPTEVKLDWIRRVAASGVDIVQVGSFVRGDKMPQMADTDDLFRILTEVEPKEVMDPDAPKNCKLESYEATPSYQQ